MREPRAEQAVADLQPVIEKAERTISGERGEPQREARELDRHRVEVDAVQDALGDRPPHPDPVGFTDVGRMTASGPHQRGLVGAREKPAGGDEEGAAAHRGIDDAQPEDLIGRRIAHQRAERPPHHVVRDRLRRVERAGRFSHTRAGLQRNQSAVDARLVVEQRLVYGAQLFDAEVAIGDALATGFVG